MTRADFDALMNSISAIHETDHLGFENEGKKPKPTHMARLTDSVYSELVKLSHRGESVDAVLRRILNLPKRVDRRTVAARFVANRSKRKDTAA